MNNILSKIVIFAAGLGIGSVVTWKLLKSEYEKRAREEIESFLNQEKEDSKSDDDSTMISNDLSDHISVTDINRDEYTNLIQTLNYTKEVAAVEKPYIITPEEFGEFSNYETISLTYYDDKVLADDRDNIIDNVEEIVGTDSLTHFGEYEDDLLHVRNDRLRCDYEISIDVRKYADVCPYLPDIEE